ncbi:MAG: S41 family peptidase [Bacteroidota bacterium]
MRFLTLLIGILFSLGLQAQDCDCLSNYQWVKKTFEENDAGFQYALDRKGVPLYEYHSEAIEAQAKQTKDIVTCQRLLAEWLSFFRAGHLDIEINLPEGTGVEGERSAEAIIQQFQNWERLDVDLESFTKYLAQKSEKDIEGVWETLSKSYRIGIRKVDNAYKGFVMEANNPYWQPGQVKLTIKQDLSEGTYYLKDHSASQLDIINLMEEDYLQLGTVMMQRVGATEPSAAIAQYMNNIGEGSPYFAEVDDQTLLIGIPSFDYDYKEEIDELIEAHRTQILSTPNLIIDIRGNGGGSDASFKELIPFLYTSPIRSVGIELRSTPRNNERMLTIANDDEYDEEIQEWAKQAYDVLNEHLGEFVNIYGQEVFVSTFDTVLPYPQHVGILIDEENGSTAEEFLLIAKQSQKVKLFGRTTFGVLDISNMYWADAPSGDFTLHYSLSKSFRLSGMAIDGIGIQPDIFLDQTLPRHEWLNYVQEVLHQEGATAPTLNR